MDLNFLCTYIMIDGSLSVLIAKGAQDKHLEDNEDGDSLFMKSYTKKKNFSFSNAFFFFYLLFLISYVLVQPL